MKVSPETHMARIGTEPDDKSGSLSPAIHLSSTFARDEEGAHSSGYIYSRLGNPTRDRLESELARVEQGEMALAFSSGMAAANALFQALSPGDRIIMPHDVYHGVRKLASEHFGRWGLVVETIDMTRRESVEKALALKAAMLWIETPSNPMVQITDIAWVAGAARKAGTRVVVDNTWSTPLITQPLLLGADIVLHSVTKYFGGHSDLLGGALVCGQKNEFSDRLRSIQQSAGAVLDPFSCWLTMRGMRTMAVRVNRQSDTAMILAHHLKQHPSVEAVFYPGLPTDPGHTIATKQMAKFGGMLSFQIRGTEAQAIRLASGLALFAHATSLGGTESLIEHRSSVEGPDSPTPKNLLRISVGLEAAADLLADLDAGLHRLISKS